MSWRGRHDSFSIRFIDMIATPTKIISKDAKSQMLNFVINTAGLARIKYFYSKQNQALVIKDKSSGSNKYTNSSKKWRQLHLSDARIYEDRAAIPERTEFVL